MRRAAFQSSIRSLGPYFSSALRRTRLISFQPMPNVSAGLHPFVRAVLASSSARGDTSPFAPRRGSASEDGRFHLAAPRTSDQGPAIDAPRTTPAGYGDSDSSGLYGGTVTPIARIPTPGPHSSDHHPDEWQDPNRPMDNKNMHPT